jgi:hypothetical protein
VKRPYSIAMRLNRIEYQAIKRHAKKRNEPPSTWAREALMETLGMVPGRSGSPYAPAAELSAKDAQEAGATQRPDLS